MDQQSFSSTPSPPRRCILLVDDDVRVRQALKRSIAGRGFYVLEADSGCAALSVAQVIELAAVVLDLWLPDINGAALLPQLLRTQPATRVIVFSGSLNDNLAAELLAAGATCCAPKPWARQVLAAIDEQLVPAA